MFIRLRTSTAALTFALLALGCAGDGDADIAMSSHPIVGGQVAKAGEFPYLVTIHMRYVNEAGALVNDHQCGGSLIRPDWVLTAAHCVQNYPDFQMRVGVGQVSLSAFPRDAAGLLIADGKNVAGVAAYWRHPKYDPLTLDYDIALVKLTSPLANGRTVDLSTAALDAKYAGPGATSIVAGWGAVNRAGDQFPDRLRRAGVPITSPEECIAASKRAEENAGFAQPVTPRMICAGGGAQDTCFGDSGGPLIVSGPHGKPLLVGLTSFGFIINEGGPWCALRGYPGVYTRVSALTNWVSGCLQDQRKCMGDQPSFCSIEGWCERTGEYLVGRETANGASHDRGACFRRARDVFEACGAPRPSLLEQSVTTHFADQRGTKRQPWPACFVTGVCRNGKVKDEGFDTFWRQDDTEGASFLEVSCFKRAPAYHSLCGNRADETVTAIYATPWTTTSRTHPRQ